MVVSDVVVRLLIHCAITQILTRQIFGPTTLIIEDYITGTEASILAICDGYTALSFPACRDYKYAGDGDVGPMTGGMGAYCPALEEDELRVIGELVIERTLRGMSIL